LRNVFAILLLSIHLFTLAGYRLVLSCLEQKADKLLVQKLDNHEYSDADLVTIKIPLHMPYTADKNEFERCDGTVQINGVFYNYVKRKQCNDTLILQCIANNEKNKLADAKNVYAKIAGDAQTSSSHHQAEISLLKLFFFECNYKTGYDLSAGAPLLSHLYATENSDGPCTAYIALPEEPPQAA
jgi:hypothetical protein